MTRSTGRAYVFVRWSGSLSIPTRLGDVAWAFEYNDRLGRFNCFYCGASESGGNLSGVRTRTFWHEKCFTLPELIKAMSRQGPDRPGYDEAKVFEVENADPELALQIVAQRSAAPEDVAARIGPLEETREVLTRYGVRGLANTKGFSAPFLWYNMLPGRSVPVRKLPVHLFQLRAAADGPVPISADEIEDAARKLAQEAPEVLNLGECFAGRIGSAFIVGMRIGLNPKLPIAEAHAISKRLEEAIRGANSKIQHVFVQTEPYPELE